MHSIGTCLFTGEKLTDKTRIEHTIPKALCGRIRSRHVTCSKFNEKSGVFDAKFASQHKLVLNVLAPLLPKEFYPGEIPVTLDNGWQAIQDSGITKLKNVIFAERYPSKKPKVCYLPDDPKAITRITKKNRLHYNREKVTKALLPGKIAHFDNQLFSTLAEVSIVKCILCAFDEVCQNKYPDFVFTRSADLAPIREFIASTITQGNKDVDINMLDRYYLGLQLDDRQICKSLKLFNHNKEKFEHIILISSNSATKTIDVLWNIFGFEIHAVRLAENWHGERFCGLITNPIFLNGSCDSIVKRGEENPFLTITRSRYKSFGLSSPPANEAPYILSEIRERAYYDAIRLVENTATDFQRKNFQYYIDNMSDTSMTLSDFIISRLQKIYMFSYNENEIRTKISDISDVVSKWESIQARELKNFSEHEFCRFISDYRRAFNSLDHPFHPPCKLVNKKILLDINYSAQD